MALTEESIDDLIETIENGSLQVRKARIISDDGVEISRTFHRHVLHPGADTSGESQRVKDIAAVVHTPAVIAAYVAQQAENEAA